MRYSRYCNLTLAFCLFIFVGISGIARADSQGPNSAGTGTDDSSFGTTSWTSPGNISSSDGSEATAFIPSGGPGDSHYLVGTNFGFSIPLSATINGILFEPQNTEHCEESIDTRIRLVKGGVIGSTDRSTGSDWGNGSYIPYGSSSDLWGTTLTPSDVNASNFGIALAAHSVNGNSCVGVDHVRATVYYTIPSPSTLSGTVYSNEGTTPIGSGKTVAVSINGAAATETTTTASDGTYSLTGLTVIAGDVITLYLDGGAEKAVTVTKGTGSDQTGLNLYQNDLITRCDNSSCSLTNANLDTADNNGDTDISSIYSISSSNLNLVTDKNLFIPSSQIYAPAGNVSLSGNFTNNGTYTKGTETVTFNKSSSTQTFNPGTSTFYAITHSGAGTLQLSSNTLTTTNNFTNSAGTFNANTLVVNIGGITDITNSTYTGSTGTQTFTGGLTMTGGALSTSGAGSVVLGNNITGNSSSTTSTISGTLDLNGSTRTLTIADGAASNDMSISAVVTNGSLIKAGAGTLTLSNTTTVGNLTISAGNITAGSNTITVGGSWSNSGTFTPNTSSLTLTGTSTFSDTTSFYNITINGGGATVTLGNPLTVTHNLAITAGTLDVSSANYEFTVGGNFTNTGTLTARAGTATFNGASQIITGSTTFYNLVKSVTSAVTLTFEAGSTQTINGTLTLQGAAGQLLSLVSSSTPTQWNINATHSRVLSYLNVQDSNNNNATAMDCTNGCTDAGNNSNWTFTSGDTTPPTISSLSPEDSATKISSTATFTIALSESITAVSGKNIMIKRVSDDTTIETIAADNSKVTIHENEITIDPDTTLDDLTEYYILIESGAFIDESGNEYAGITSSETWNFTTSDTTAPIISTFSPPNKARGISLTTPLTLTFNEAVTPVSGKKITIKYTSTDTPVESISVSGSRVSGSGTTTITVRPVHALDAGTSYYVVIDSSAFVDLYDNPYTGISLPSTWSFTTAGSPTLPPPIAMLIAPTDNILPALLTTPIEPITPCSYGECDTPSPSPTLQEPLQESLSPGTTEVGNISDSIPPQPTSIGETLTSLVAKLSGQSKEDVLKFVQQKGVVVATTLVGASVIPTIPVLLIHTLPQLLNVLPFLGALFSLHRPKSRWGIVVDSDFGKPIAHAVVQVFEAKFHQLKDTQMTGPDGQFGFLLPPGQYYFVVSQNGFNFPALKKPSTVILHENEHFYTGEEFESNMEDPDNIPRLVIPMDREETTVIPHLFFHRYIERILMFVDGIGITFLLAGGMVNTFFLLAVPNTITVAFELVYLLLFALKLYMITSHQRGLGEALDEATGKPLDLAIMRLYDSKTNRIIQTRVTNVHGKFFLLVPKGMYTASISKLGYKTSLKEHVSIYGKSSKALGLHFGLVKGE